MTAGKYCHSALALALSLVLVGTTGLTSAAAASSHQDGSISATVQAVTSAVATDAPGLTTLYPDASSAIIASDPESLTAVAIPREADTGIFVGDVENLVGISLPTGSETASAAVDAQSKTAVYRDAAEDTDFAVQPTEGAGVRVMSVLHGHDAPASFEYGLTLPDGAHLRQTPDGGVDVVDPSGAAVGTFAPAWATDANGDAVPTAYIIRGDALVQLVDHGPDSAFPIVADPAYTRNCGIITCTLYVSVAQTRLIFNNLNTKAAQSSGVISVGVACGIVGFVGTPVAGIACGIASGLGTVFFIGTFNDARRYGQCATTAAGARAPLGRVPLSNQYCYAS